MRVAVLAGAAAVFVLAQVDVTHAQFWGGRDAPLWGPRNDQRQAAPIHKARPKPKSTRNSAKRDVSIPRPFGENMPKGPLQLVVVLGEQKAILYSNGVRVGDTKVSTGTPGHPTPTGVFSVIQKDRWHRSNLYGAAPMFYMHRLTWSGVALHEGFLPGFAASHGCIRVPAAFVSRLWGISKMGMRVVVVRHEVAPRQFSHSKLFNPATKPPDNTPRVSSIDGLRPAIDSSADGETSRIRVAEAQPAEGVTASDAPDIGLNAATSPDTPVASSERGAPSAVVTVPEPATTATVPTPPAEAVPAPSTAPVPAGAGPAAVPAAITAEPVKPAIEPNELQLPRPVPLRTRSAQPTKLNGQVAVFISRKEKRLYVRQAFVPLFDMPVEIADPQKPFGTHVYTALGASDGEHMRWNVISLAPANPPRARTRSEPKQTKKAKGKAAPAPVATSVPFSDAGEALDRVTIPQEAVDRIAELLIPGSSLVISDEGLGRETGRYTEFIVETRH
jgi:lipoprotein-anchoring transpeptidase ErfK/SrfK